MRVPRPLVVTVLSLALGTALVACGGGDDKGKDTKVTIDTAGGEKTDGNAVTLKGRLTGTEEIPGPGVKEGIGAFLIDVGGGKGCYDLKVTMGEKPTKAHIHEGAAGVSGPVVVDLKPTFEPGESAMTAKSCVDLPADVSEKLVGNPAAYYVNVHSEGHPDGAIRGQLATF